MLEGRPRAPAGERRRGRPGAGRSCRAGAAPHTVAEVLVDVPGAGQGPGSTGRGECAVTVSVTGTSTGHPLAALTPEEITAAVAIVRGDGRWTDSWRFAYVGLEEPPKASRPGLRRRRPGRPARADDRGGRARGRRHRDRGVGDHRRRALVRRGGGDAPGTAVRGVAARHRGPEGGSASGRRPCAGAASTISTACRSTPGRPGRSTWPTRRAAGSAGASATCARRPTTTATPGPWRASSDSWTWPGARFSRSWTPAWCPFLPRGAATTPRTTVRCATI